MFRSGGSKRQAGATGSPNASEERKVKNVGTSTAKTTVSTGTSTSSKGKTWRRIKSGSGPSAAGLSQKVSKHPAASPVDGGFLPREEIAGTPLPDDNAALPPAGQPPPADPDSQPLELSPAAAVEDMLVETAPVPPPPPKVEAQSAQVSQRSRQPRVPSRPALPAFPAFPALSPLQCRPAKKKPTSAGSKSEPALNVYLHQRRMVSQSKFRRMQDERVVVAQDETPKMMTRYQKLARDTKNLVARISGEIPSTQKIRQALKLPAGGATHGNGSNGKTHSDVDVTDPEFVCDEQTAAILLAELEGASQTERQKTESGSRAEASAHGQQAERGGQQPGEREQQPGEREQHPGEREQARTQRHQADVSEHSHYVVPLASRADDGQAERRSSAGSPEYIKTHRFSQLRSLYRSLERLNELEKLVPTDECRNPAASTDAIIDFDLWRRLRQREKAQEEMRNLATWIQAAQREGECYFGTSPPAKWRGGAADPGLRIKEQSVRHLADKYKSLAEAKRFATQSLPRNFGQCGADESGAQSAAPVSRPPGRLSRSSQRRSSLTGQQVAALKSQLCRVYTPPSRYETVVSAAPPPVRHLAPALCNPQLYVRSVSESSRDCTLAKLEQRRRRLMESQKALSVAGVGRAVARSQSASSAQSAQSVQSVQSAKSAKSAKSASTNTISEAQRRTLSMRLGAEVKERYMSGRPAAQPQPQPQPQLQPQPQPPSQSQSEPQPPIQPRSTRAAIQYVQQLSQHMSRKLAASPPRRLSPSSPGPYRTQQSRSSSRESSASSQQDYLLVLTPRGRHHADVESAVQEWADSTVAGATPSPTPAVPRRSSSLNLRASLEDDSHSSNSSVQTVIHRDVQKKVDFFEEVIAHSAGDPCDVGVVPFRATQSVGDLRRSASALVGHGPRHRRTRSVILPQRSQSLSVQRAGSSASAYASVTDVRLGPLTDRVKSVSPSPSGRRSSPASASGGGSHYLNLVKKGDVVKKCQYFSSPRVDQATQPQRKPAQKQWRLVHPPASSRSVPDSLPLCSAAERFNRNQTVIKGQEMGDVSFTKRRYEPERQPPPNRFRTQFGSASSAPSLRDGSWRMAVLDGSWSRRLAAAGAHKRVSFPTFASNSRAGSRAGSRASSDTGSRSGGKKLDFTRVKPTLLSSARLALRQAQTAADPTAHQHPVGGRMSRPAVRSPWSAAGGSYSDIPSTVSVSSATLASHTDTTATGANPTNQLTLASPDLSLKSTSDGSIRSRRSMSSPLPALPVSAVARPAPVPSNPSGATTRAIPQLPQSTALHGAATKECPATAKPPASSKVTTAPWPSAPPAGTDGQPLAPSSSCHSGTFDASMHQPTYRYTPPPPRCGARPNRIHSIYDSYATYPRHRVGMQSPTRPPLPAEWAHLSSSPRQPARTGNPAG